MHHKVMHGICKKRSRGKKASFCTRSNMLWSLVIIHYYVSVRICSYCCMKQESQEDKRITMVLACWQQSAANQSNYHLQFNLTGASDGWNFYWEMPEPNHLCSSRHLNLLNLHYWEESPLPQ